MAVRLQLNLRTVGGEDRQVRFHFEDILASIADELQASKRSILPDTFEVAVYLQRAFSGQADQTCAWGVVSSHQGDIRQCPASTGPLRPPERMLGNNITIEANGTGVFELSDSTRAP